MKIPRMESLKMSYGTMLLLVACSTTPVCLAQKKLALPYEKFILENGLEVVLHEDHSDPIVAVATVVHVGSNREKPGRTGFAHFFEHMSFNDSENTPQGANRKLIPQWGGQRNGGTWSDGTIYYEVVPKDAFDKILWIDSDRLGFMINTVTNEALEAEKQVVKNEKRQNVDNTPYGFTDEIIRSNLYPPNHPYHWDVIGSLPDLQAATLADVKEFYEQYYGAANATLVIVGDIDPEETKEKVRKWFGEIRMGPPVTPMNPQPVTLTQTKKLFFEDNFARLPELRMVFPTVPTYHPDSYALDILSQLLSSSKNSPLYKVIVEDKKLAPGVFISQNSQEIAGELEIRIRGNTQANLDEVKRAVDEALMLFEKNGITEKELKRVKAGAETALYQSISTVLNKAFRLAQDNEFAGNPAQIVQTAQLIQTVSREDVLRVYNDYIKNKNCIVTSVVPKGQTSLIVKDSKAATVWQEQVVPGIQNENVTRGSEANVTKTPTKYDRSEPPFGNVPLFQMPAIWEEQLSNGIRILGIENNELPLVSFDITIPGGHSLDSPEKAGTANLMAQLLMQGTKTKSPAELEEAFGLLGTTVFIQCTNEEIRLTVNCLTKNLEPTVELIKEMMLTPRWDEVEFKRLKSAIETNLKGADANAAAVANRTFSKILFGQGHIFSIPVNGTLQSIPAITLEDLKSFYHNYFSPAHATLHVAGDVSHPLASKAFGKLASWTGKKVNLPQLPEAVPANARPIYFINFTDAKQSVIFAGRISVAGSHPDHNNIDFANEILGGGSSGKLFQILRIEKGFTYGAFSGIQKWKESSPFLINTSVRSNATLPALEIISEMIKNYESDFTSTEADITKNKVLKNNTLLYESLPNKLGILREISKFGLSKRFIEEDQAELLQMSVDDFKNVISRYLNPKDLIYLVVGDKATQWEEIKKFNPHIVELDMNGNPVMDTKLQGEK